MNDAIRTERRFGVTSQLTQQARHNLFVIRSHEGWPDVLDVMEMCCIELETKLINTEPAKPNEVLANHQTSKVAWLIFTHLQEKIEEQVTLYLGSVAKQPLVPAMTREEQEIENILDPTRPAPFEPGYEENF